MKIIRLLSRLYDLPNAFRVLDIMDSAGCGIEHVERDGLADADYWKITVPYYVTGHQAKDLQTIVQFKRQYKPRNKLWKKLVFRRYREQSRVLWFWV